MYEYVTLPDPNLDVHDIVDSARIHNVLITGTENSACDFLLAFHVPILNLFEIQRNMVEN